ncbi:hypothetical protein E2C01_036041 [Portunus trituberculatus]|uniref:Uncharacterized protein n=1 Tax=Portunus trituberculatus TaxID=210409 RepID=A0A5B7FAY5_PORTR|nr:hypothetical protein [Portunus trituberculatus]
MSLSPGSFNPFSTMTHLHIHCAYYLEEVCLHAMDPQSATHYHACLIECPTVQHLPLVIYHFLKVVTGFRGTERTLE